MQDFFQERQLLTAFNASEVLFRSEQRSGRPTHDHSRPVPAFDLVGHGKIIGRIFKFSRTSVLIGVNPWLNSKHTNLWRECFFLVNFEWIFCAGGLILRSLEAADAI